MVRVDFQAFCGHIIKPGLTRLQALSDCPPPQMTVSAGAIIEHLDVLGDLDLGHLTSRVNPFPDPFLL